MQLRFKKDTTKTKVWLEIPSIMMGKENLKVEISQCTAGEINRVTANSYTKVQGRHGTSQYLDNARLLSNLTDMVASHMHGWNLLNDKNEPVECTKENAKIFLDNFGNIEIKISEKIDEMILSEANSEITLQAFIGNKIQDPKFFLSGDQKN